jgi:protease-4
MRRAVSRTTASSGNFFKVEERTMSAGNHASFPEGGMVEPPVPAPAPRRRRWLRWLWVLIGLTFLFTCITTVPAMLAAALVVGAGLEGRPHFREVFVMGDRQAVEKVVLLPVSGVIEPGLSTEFKHMLDQAAEDEQVKAIVLRLQSPGGTVESSDRMYHRLREFRRKKDIPVVALIEGIGASGAYYVACGADRLMVEPTALTGSIGVRAMFVDLSKLLTEWGVHVESIQTGPFKDTGSPFRPLRPEEKQRWEELMKHFYSRFLDVVLEGREGKMNREKLVSLANGDVYTADEAVRYGLVDRVGYLDEAVREAQELAGLEKARVVEYRRLFRLLSLLEARAKANDPLESTVARGFRQWYMPTFYYLWAEPAVEAVLFGH